jgi:hypothetical protein
MKFLWLKAFLPSLLLASAATAQSRCGPSKDRPLAFEKGLAGPSSTAFTLP